MGRTLNRILFGLRLHRYGCTPSLPRVMQIRRHILFDLITAFVRPTDFFTEIAQERGIVYRVDDGTVYLCDETDYEKFVDIIDAHNIRFRVGYSNLRRSLSIQEENAFQQWLVENDMKYLFDDIDLSYRLTRMKDVMAVRLRFECDSDYGLWINLDDIG